MKTSDQLSTDLKPGILLVGEPWSGKSTLAMQFPDPWVCDADNNLSRIAPNMKGKRFWYDRIDVDDTGKPLPEEQQWLRLLRVATDAANHPDVKYLIFDSMTAIGDKLERFIVSQASATKDLVVGGQKMMTQQHWNPYKVLWLKLITEVRACDKPCIFIAHKKLDKDEVSGTIMYRPNIGGQLADSIGRLFTDIWHCTAVPGQPTPANPSGVEYWVETVPQPRMNCLGSSLGLPPRFKASIETIKQYLK